ncbi:hypothetical protein BDZ89DRAFT_1056798 [Hymenopellis radicata]|nr:hypothetical protein BDZ89DRAFT_1056798 [Hymenopellis radicata]
MYSHFQARAPHHIRLIFLIGMTCVPDYVRHRRPPAFNTDIRMVPPEMKRALKVEVATLPYYSLIVVEE